MEELVQLLSRIKPGVDFATNESLIDDAVLDSFDIISIASAISEEFDVQITASHILPENFNSAKAMYALIQRLEEE